MSTNGHLGQMNIWGKEGPQVPYAFSSKSSQMGVGVNGHLGQKNIWGKGVPQVF